ncbi:hypothetical protein NO995_08565 [Aestuariibaculum sp. M13]|uniref:CBU_0592 family membrane protein n=1 Tax=Aestuariibaculum sp. M13 TaxID=2967132 RepID=UPI002159D80B|nr:hypothetical protein [Aestuariibaculum sp. M13]MCR8667733.1 hypothetical protein [Aestuariibaculum sp. M13]
MNLTDWIGFIGVSLILLAYILNVSNRISNTHMAFILLNFIGASTACFASVLLNYWPFIILEGVWATVSLVSFWKYFRT